MSWVGLADAARAEFDLTGLTNRPRRHALKLADRPHAQACRGTLLFEANVAQFTVPRPLLAMALGASFSISFAFGENDKLDFSLSVGDASWEEHLPLKITDELQVVRVSLAWDTATGAAVLSVFQPRSQHLAQVLLTGPKPVPWAALRTLIHDAPGMCGQNDVTFVALSRAFEPAGAMPGLTRRTPVSTPGGSMHIHEITPGDSVLGVDGRAHQVRAVAKRILPARGSFAPHHLRAPYLGLAEDLRVSGETLIELQGSDVEYFLGVERVLAQANQVAEREAPFQAAGHITVCYYQLLLDQPELLDLGIGLMSLNLGAAEAAGLASVTTLWADMAGSGVSAHLSPPYPLARPYEVVTLNANRAA